MIKNCVYCGKEFKSYLCQNRLFCCVSCATSHRNTISKYKNGISLYRRYKKNKCEICNSELNLIAHHKDKNRENNKKENIMTICYSCHSKSQIHNKVINFKSAYLSIERNEFGMFGQKKYISKEQCLICGETYHKYNGRQKYCISCNKKYNIGHKKKGGK